MFGRSFSFLVEAASQGRTPGKDISPLYDITKGCLTRNACFSSLLGVVRAVLFSLFGEFSDRLEKRWIKFNFASYSMKKIRYLMTDCRFVCG